MSNEPTFKRLLAQPAATGPAAEVSTERMLAAIELMESAIRSEPETIARLRAELGEMANAIAEIKSAVDAARQRATHIDALLQSLEDRTRRLIALVNPPADVADAGTSVATPPPRPADEQAFLDALGTAAGTGAAPQTKPDRVPTVSDVVSQLGGVSDEKPPASESEGTSVAMLEAMVERLAAAMPAAPPPAADAPLPDPEPPAPEDALLETALPEAVVPESASAELASTEGAWSEPTAETQAAAPAEAVMPEVELLSNFARMEAVPYLPPEVGTAVIFAAKAKPEPSVDEEEAFAAPEPDGERSAEPTRESGDLDLDALLFEAGQEADPDPAAPLLEPTHWPEHAEPAPAAAAALPDQATPEAHEPRAEIPTVAAGRPPRSRPANTIRWLRSNR